MSTRIARVVLSVLVTSPWIACHPRGDEIPARAVSALQSPQIPIDGSVIPQFVQRLPLLSSAGGTIDTVVADHPLDIHMCEFDANVLPTGTFAPGVQPRTRVWGYRVGACPPNGPDDPAADTYTGPVIVSERGTTTDVTWINDLGSAATTSVLAYRYSTDQTIHWADPENTQCAMMGGVPAFGSVCAQNYAGSIPAVTHLHGAEVPPTLDGNPDAWFTSDGAHHGSAYFSGGAASNAARYLYPNAQPAAPLWFHDHTLGATRLNVYAGLAGGYYIEDPGILPVGTVTTRGTAGTCTQGCLPPNLLPVAQVIPLVIQDRIFDTEGQLFLPADSAGGTLWSPNPEHPYWVPEFVGNAILVNGKAWPYVEVEARRYRFLFLNGSNARTYELTIPGGPTMFVISTEGGYLDAPVAVNRLLMQPGERYEVILDFAGLAGRSLLLRNTGRTPFPKGEPPHGSTLGRILQFRVGAPPAGGDQSYDPAAVPAVPLRSGDNAIVRLVDPANGTAAVPVTLTRQLTLNELENEGSTVIDPVTGVTTTYPGGPLEVLLNNTHWSATTTETPQEGATELWEIVNLTADAHPIHLHLAQFQLMNRQRFDAERYEDAYETFFPGGEFIPEFGPPLAYDPSPTSGGTFGGNPDVTPFLQGPAAPPETYEAGWKDTVITYPGHVTRFIVRWAPPTLPITTQPADLRYPFDPSGAPGYVWHCHIIDHEDNEMMRPTLVQRNPAAPAGG